MQDNKTIKAYFKELYVIEKEARDLYNEFLADLKDEATIKIIEGIRNDEEEHMKIAQELIKIID